MPTYEYQCGKCGYEFERFQPIKSRSLRKCPVCKKNSLKRLIGSGSGLIFKGTGFYQTDYRSESYTKAEKNDKKETDKNAAKKETKSKESKPPDKTKPNTEKKST